jgi:hypothetical protein
MKNVHVREHFRRRRVRRKQGRSPRIPAFHVVTAEEPFGELTSKEVRGCESPEHAEGGKLFGVDQLLGDGDYVFLSLIRPTTMVSSRSSCFVFDAEDLIGRGALLRTEDIAMTREGERFEEAILDAETNAFNRYWELHDRKWPKGVGLTLSEERELDELENMLGNEFELIEIEFNQMTPEQLRWFIGRSLTAQRAFRDLEERRDATTFQGEDALRELKRAQEVVDDGERKRATWPLVTMELLVPRRLSLYGAVYAGTASEAEYRYGKRRRA